MISVISHWMILRGSDLPDQSSYIYEIKINSESNCTYICLSSDKSHLDFSRNVRNSSFASFTLSTELLEESSSSLAERS